MLADNPEKLTLAADASMQAAATELAARLFERASAGRPNPGATLVTGLHADIDAWLARAGLAPRPPKLAATRGSAEVWTVRAGDGQVIVLVSARDAPSLAALSRPLPHYGGQSYLVFDGARVIERGTWPTQPQVWQLR
jgi:hypothetical protein